MSGFAPTRQSGSPTKNGVQVLTALFRAGTIFPDSELPKNSRKLRGFIWRGDERINSKEEIFDEDDNNIELVYIRGIENPIDIDAEEEERVKVFEYTSEDHEALGLVFDPGRARKDRTDNEARNAAAQDQ